MEGTRVTYDTVTRHRASGPVRVFRCTDRHPDGEPFYVFGQGSRGFHFTLPPGTYRLSGGVVMPGKPYRPTPAQAPKGGVRVPFPKEVRVKWCDNPHRASIDLVNGVIYADRSLLTLPEFVRVFVLFHEIGHYWHKDEQACDRFAMDQMIARGFNPSQCVTASKWTIRRAGERVDACFEHAKNFRP